MSHAWLQSIGLSNLDNLDYISIVGPTGVGKTEAALKLARAFPGCFEVVSCDSVQVYQGLDVGSAKVSKAIRLELEHHLIDICNVCDRYDAKRFTNDAKNAISAIRKKGKCAILVGGTFLYLQAFLHGLSPISEISPHAKVQVSELMAKGLEHAWQRLKEIDPNYVRQIEKNDQCRIERALLVFYSTKKTMSHWHSQPRVKCHNFVGKTVAILPNCREQLKLELANRFDEMLARGMIDELSCVLEKNPQLDENCPSMRSIGYRQVLSYLNGQLSHGQMRLDAITATRRYLKRQLTWLRSMPNIDQTFYGIDSWF